MLGLLFHRRDKIRSSEYMQSGQPAQAGERSVWIGVALLRDPREAFKSGLRVNVATQTVGTTNRTDDYVIRDWDRLSM